LGVEAIRERTEYALRRRFATIASVKSIAEELEKTRPAASSAARP
jgi:hypothetical protein